MADHGHISDSSDEEQTIHALRLRLERLSMENRELKTALQQSQFAVNSIQQQNERILGSSGVEHRSAHSQPARAVYGFSAPKSKSKPPKSFAQIG